MAQCSDWMCKDVRARPGYVTLQVWVDECAPVEKQQSVGWLGGTITTSHGGCNNGEKWKKKLTRLRKKHPRREWGLTAAHALADAGRWLHAHCTATVEACSEAMSSSSMQYWMDGAELGM